MPQHLPLSLLPLLVLLGLTAALDNHEWVQGANHNHIRGMKEDAAGVVVSSRAPRPPPHPCPPPHPRPPPHPPRPRRSPAPPVYPPVPPPPPPPCVSIHTIINHVPQLSQLAAVVKKVPEVKRMLQDKNAKYTLLAPKDGVFPKPSHPFNHTQWSTYLQHHILRGTYSNSDAWLSRRERGVKTVNAWKLRLEIAIGDDFQNNISFVYINAVPKKSPSYQGVHLLFQSNLPNPAIPSCKGVVYVTDAAFLY